MTTPSTPQRAEHPYKGSKPAVAVKKWLIVLIIALVLAVTAIFSLRSYHANTYTIPSASMQPGIQIGDRIEIDPEAYQQAAPQHGDVVVFDGTGSFYPYESETTWKRIQDQILGVIGMRSQGNAVVKRVIGLPGDTVECCDDTGRILVNDEPLEEPYLAEPDQPASSSPFLVNVPDNRVFLLGDNRYDSVDSRALLGAPGGGMIQKKKIYGPVVRIR